MSDLDGMDAFTEVLDRLSRAEARATELQERLSAADLAARQAKNDSDRSLVLAQQMGDRANKGCSALKELWEAAESLRDLVAPIARAEEKHTVDRVSAALVTARDYCDHPPF